MATRKKTGKSEYNRKKKACSLGAEVQHRSFLENAPPNKGLSDIIKEIALQALMIRRTLSKSPADDCIPAYERHMKYGPIRNYWNEFVFPAYVNHRPEVIYLKGLPDIPESLPHSKLYRG